LYIRYDKTTVHPGPNATCDYEVDICLTMDGVLNKLLNMFAGVVVICGIIFHELYAIGMARSRGQIVIHSPHRLTARSPLRNRPAGDPWLRGTPERRSNTRWHSRTGFHRTGTAAPVFARTG
jgi:hypothetical protein